MKKALSVALSFLLVFSFLPVPAVAESANQARETFSEAPSDVSASDAGATASGADQPAADGQEPVGSQGAGVSQTAENAETSTDGTVSVKTEVTSSAATDTGEADASSSQGAGSSMHVDSVQGQAGGNYEVNGVTFWYTELADSGNVAITTVSINNTDKGNGQLELEIPGTIESKTVISLGTSDGSNFSIDDSFKATVGSISIPKEVLYIESTSGLLSKSKLPNLKSVTFESGSAITALPDKFFANSNVSSVTLPEKLIAIGDEAFSPCTNLTSITIPDSVQSIGTKAFYGCGKLTSIALGKNVGTIGEDAFDGTALTEVDIPDNVTEIGPGAFSLNSLTSVKFGSSMEASKLKTIGDRAFVGARLTSVEIPNSVKTIGEEAFHCEFAAASTVEMAYGTTTLQSVKLDTSQSDSKLETIGARAFKQAAITEVALPNSLKLIGSGAPSDYNNGLGIVADGAFSECTLLKTVKWPVSPESAMTTVGGFDRCVSLEDSTISSLPSWITTIAPGAFAENTFTDIQIPSTVTNIGDYAFAWLKTYNTANEISSITFGAEGNALTIGKHAFESASATIAQNATIELPLRVNSVGENAFRGLRQTDNRQQGAKFRVLYKGIDVGTYGDDASANVSILPFEPSVGTTIYYPSDAAADSSFMKMKAAVEAYENAQPVDSSKRTQFIAEDPVPESTTYRITGTVPVGAKVFVHVTETYTPESGEVTTTSSLDATVDAAGSVTLGERVAATATVQAIVRLDGYEDYNVYPHGATQAVALTEDWNFTVEQSALKALPKCTINGTVPEGATVQLIVGTKAETPKVSGGSFTYTCCQGTTVSAIVSLDGYLDYVVSPEPSKESAPLNSDWSPTVTTDMMTPLSKTGTLQVEADGPNRWFCTVAVFDSSGKIVAQQQTSTVSALVVDKLVPGEYTAVAFQNNDFFSSITSVDDFAKMGIPNTSYVTGTATVKAQETTKLTLTVPKMDTSALSSVVSSGSVTASVANAVPGSVFYARVTYQMGDGHPANSITVNVPDGLTVEAASTAAHAYGAAGWDSTTHQLTINPVGQDKQAATLFVALKATAAGTFALSAAATSGSTTAPIGSVDIDIPPIRLDVPQGSLTSDTFDVTVYAQPLKQITFKIGGKELGTTATTNLLGRATATLTIPAEVLNAYAYYLVEAAVQGDYPGSASANVHYDKVTSLQTATLQEFKFFHGGQTVYLVRNGKDVPGYYTCIQKPRDHADLYSPTWPFTVVIDSAYELEGTATLRLGMLDESVRNETMALASVTDVSGEVGTKRYTYTADVAIGSGINHDLESNEIPATFDVVYTFADGDNSEFPQAVVDAMKQNYAISRATWEHSLDAYKSDAAALTPNSQNVMNLTSIPYTENGESKTLAIGELTADDFNSIICRQGYKHGNWGQVGIQNPEGEWEFGFSAEDRAEYEEYEAALDEMFQLAADVMGQSVPLNACDSYEDYLQKNFGYSVDSPRDPAELERQGYTIIRDSNTFSVANAGTLNASGQQVAPTWYAVKTAEEGDSNDTGVRLSGGMTAQDTTSGQAKGQASYYDSNGVSMQLNYASVALDIAKENALPTAIGAADLYVGKLANKTGTQLANDIAWNTNLRTAKAAGSDTEIAKKFLELTGRSRTATQIKGMSELPVENTQKPAKNLKIAGYATAGVGLAFTAYQVKKNADRAGDLWSEAGDVAGQVDYLDMLRRRYTNLGMGLTPCFYAIQDEIKAARKLAEALRSEARWAEIDSAVSYGTTAVGIVVPGAGLATFGFGLGWGAFNSGWSASKAQELERLRQTYEKAKAHRENTCKGMQAKSLKKRKTPILDPSGFVYEAVEDNRLEGVTATISYQLDNGTWQEWNASDYDQVNDQVTGEGGLFSWDVPLGSWKVEFSKAGYKTVVAIVNNVRQNAAATHSLSVLPEWTNIAVGLVSDEAPTVTDVSSDGDDVVVTFKQFMKTGAGQTPTITVDGTSVESTWNNPVAGKDETAATVQLSRSLRFTVPEGAKCGDVLAVALSGGVNYAGTALADTTRNVTLTDYAQYTYQQPASTPTYTAGQVDGLTFAFKRSVNDSVTFDRFQALYLGKAGDELTLVDPRHYTVTRGSAIVTLNPAYLATFAVGDYVLAARFSDSSDDPSTWARASFKVTDAQASASATSDDLASRVRKGTGMANALPNTGDGLVGAAWACAAAALIALVACAVAWLASRRPHRSRGKHAA